VLCPSFRIVENGSANLFGAEKRSFIVFPVVQLPLCSYNAADNSDTASSVAFAMTTCNILCFQEPNFNILKKNSVVLSPLANYTDRAIAAGQRI
jgi:hypothetical protein